MAGRAGRRPGACDRGLRRALVADTLGPRLYREPADAAVPLIQRPIGELVGDDGTGVAIVVWSGLDDTEALRTAGRFSNAALPQQGGWSNKQQ